LNGPSARPRRLSRTAKGKKAVSREGWHGLNEWFNRWLISGSKITHLAGIAETTGFAAVETGGIVLDATGVWAIVGAPATAIAAAGVTHGATLTATGSANFAKSAKELYQRMSRSEGGAGVPSKVTDNPISKNMKTRVPDDEITPPIKRGNAPISKKDKRPIEIHHEGQDPNGPFHEMHASDHRYGDNYKKNHPNYNGQSRIDRKQFRKDVRKYWESEWDRGRFNKK
jgi:hypothetical protein